ncbi:MAG: helix-turn-helix transcriptional regulator [Haloplanus sp.]
MPDTALEYLVGSPVRPATLTALRDAGPLSIRTLEGRVSASRRTLKRTLGTMESRGWVRPVDGGYQLTALGASILAAYERCRETKRIAEEFSPFLRQTPAPGFDLDLDTLAEATLIRTDDDPTAPIDRLLELRADATRVRECAPFLLLDSVRQLADRVANGEPPPQVTLILRDCSPTPEGYSPEYCDRFETLLSASSVDLYRTDDVPFAFGIADDHAFIGSADTDGMPGTLVESDSPEFVDWVERTFEQRREAATPLGE